MNSHALHVKGWLVFMLLGLLILPIFFRASDAQERVMRETVTIQKVFGEQTSDKLVTRANAIFDFFFIKTGILHALQKQQATERDKTQSEKYFKKLGVALLESTNAYMLSMITNMYGFTLRLVILFAWLPLLAPIAIGFFTDAYVARFIKLNQFGYYSPAVYSVAAHTMIFTIMLPICYLVIPFVMSPLWLPGLAMMLFLSMWLAIQHAQRMLK